jgi:hypothetical protein
MNRKSTSDMLSVVESGVAVAVAVGLAVAVVVAVGVALPPTSSGDIATTFTACHVGPV